MFNPDASQWLMIDSGNCAVPNVVVTSLADGLELLGRGRCAALVGHLRDGVGVVDVDVPAAPLGEFASAEISDWLQRRGCWTLRRPSGGSPGRSHVFFARKDYRFAAAAHRTGLAAEVEQFLIDLAADLGVRKRDFDLRDAVRPLSSPHRHGVVTTPEGDLREALRSLKRVLPHSPNATRLRPRAKVKRTQEPLAPQTSARVIPLGLLRLQRPLRREWREYLTTGVVPHGSWAAGATESREAVEVDRSLVESACTRELAWATGDPEVAWRIIHESHPRAMTKAKDRGYSWWTPHVWNPLVKSAGALIATGPAAPSTPATPPPEVLQAVSEARAALQRLSWSTPARQRATLLLVGHHLLDRVLRERKRRVPCPERDLQLDCGLGDRKAIRRVLKSLDGHLGTLHTDCLDSSKRDSSSFEFEINEATCGGGRQNPPPVLDPPPMPGGPPPPKGLWLVLPRASHSLWRTLLSAPEPLEFSELVVKAGLVERPSDTPSKSQRTTARAALVALKRSGMARQTEMGLWEAASLPRAVEVELEAEEAYTAQFEQVEAERVQYRTTRTTIWSEGRARAYKQQRAREVAWWDSLAPAARAERRAAKRLEFQQMSIAQQAARKAEIAERRTRQGEDESSVHARWVNSLSGDEYLSRSIDRAVWFRRLSRAERTAHVDAWARHRQRFGMTGVRSARAERIALDGVMNEVLPDEVQRRDDVFLERQGTLPEVPHAQPAAHAAVV